MTSLLNIKDVRERLGLGQGATYGLIASGSIPSLRVGMGNRSIRVREEDLDRWIRSRVEGGSGGAGSAELPAPREGRRARVNRRRTA